MIVQEMYNYQARTFLPIIFKERQKNISCDCYFASICCHFISYELHCVKNDISVNCTRVVPNLSTGQNMKKVNMKLYTKIKVNFSTLCFSTSLSLFLSPSISPLRVRDQCIITWEISKKWGERDQYILTRRSRRSVMRGRRWRGPRHGPTDCLLLILDLIITSRSGSGSK